MQVRVHIMVMGESQNSDLVGGITKYHGRILPNMSPLL